MLTSHKLADEWPRRSADCVVCDSPMPRPPAKRAVKSRAFEEAHGAGALAGELPPASGVAKRGGGVRRARLAAIS